MKIYLLEYSQKHGHDYSCFSSEELAYEHGIEVMRNNLCEWGEGQELLALSDEELWKSWANISGETEFFEIIQLTLDA